MRLSKRIVVAQVGVLMLTACGGGGGAGGGGSSENNSWLTFTPSRIESKSYAGEDQELEVVATSSKTIAERLNAAIVSKDPVISSDVTIAEIGGLSFRAKMRLSKNLPPGTHSGQFELRLCRDDPATCRDPYPGSPWFVPYRFVVLPTTNLKPLELIPGAVGWTTYQGNALRTGYVSAQVNPADITMRFKWVPEEGGKVQPTSLVADGRQLIFSSIESRNVVRAIDEATGLAMWRSTDITSDDGPSQAPLAVMGNRVYAATKSVNALETSSGSRSWNASGFFVSSQAPGSLIAQGGKVVAVTMGSVDRLDQAQGVLDWSAHLPIWSTSRYPQLAADDKHIVGFDGESLTVLRFGDGSVVSSVKLPDWPYWGATASAPPVLDGAGAAFIVGLGSNGRLARFDTATSSMRWSINDMFCTPPVLADGVIYVLKEISGRKVQLEARSPDTGALQWSWVTPIATLDDRLRLVVVGKHAFLSGSSGFSSGAYSTFAVDLTTRQVVWSYPMGGNLVVSPRGVLYIVANVHSQVSRPGSSAIVAFNLR